MSASSLPKLLKINPGKAEELLEQLIEMSSMAQKQMRGFITTLRPMELEGGATLEQAVNKWFPDYCRQNGLQGSLEWRLKNPLSEAKEHQLFFIVQEALANVVKHAGATNVSVVFAETEHNITLTVDDDGEGFAADKVKKGYGLSTMRERASKLGGDVNVVSKPGSGTRVKVTIPHYHLSEEDENRL
jgi:NarL family two-component system sensor histidine kinase LiaS